MSWLAQEALIRAEFLRVKNALESSKAYPDLTNYANTCKNWLLALVMMGPDDVQHLHSDGFWSDAELESSGELSPTSKALKSEACMRMTITIQNQHIQLHHYHE